MSGEKHAIGQAEVLTVKIIISRNLPALAAPIGGSKV
jgi:hypothetical protein